MQPPTPSSSDSRFTKMAKGLARDIEAEQRSMWGAALREADGDVRSERKDVETSLCCAVDCVRVEYDRVRARRRELDLLSKKKMKTW